MKTQHNHRIHSLIYIRHYGCSSQIKTIPIPIEVKHTMPRCRHSRGCLLLHVLVLVLAVLGGQCSSYGLRLRPLAHVTPAQPNPLLRQFGVAKGRKSLVFTTSSALFSSSRGSSGYSGNSGNSGNSGSSSRRRMGPPQRKPQLSEQNEFVGRISVYCVGSALDLQALRAHVFRRGFSSPLLEPPLPPTLTSTEGGNNGNAAAAGGSDSSDNGFNRFITQSISSETDIDDEVLHVSNDPMQRLNLNLADYFDSDWQQQRDLGDMDGLSALSSDPSQPTEQLSQSPEASDSFKTAPIINGGWQPPPQMLLLARQDIFYFDYGCVVFWGLTPREERAALTELKAFTVESCSNEEVEDSFDTMEFIYDRKANAQKPIRFDRIKIRSMKIEEKLAHSYAMAQSSKLFVFESRVLRSLETTRYLPKELAASGRINRSKKELNQLIGSLFVEQTEVNLFSSILDSPDFLWDDDQHKPAYDYIRAYLEVDDRVALLNSRLGVIRELLDVLNAQIADNNSARLEWIVIWLITIEVILSIASNPLFAGKRIISSILVPTAIVIFKKINWSGFL